MTTVQLFITCLVDSFYPQTGEAPAPRVVNPTPAQLAGSLAGRDKSSRPRLRKVTEGAGSK